MSSDINLVQREGKFSADFKVKKCIGNGSYGCVYQVKQKSDKSIHAIKKIKFDSNPPNISFGSFQFNSFLKRSTTNSGCPA